MKVYLSKDIVIPLGDPDSKTYVAEDRPSNLKRMGIIVLDRLKKGIQSYCLFQLIQTGGSYLCRKRE